MFRFSAIAVLGTAALLAACDRPVDAGPPTMPVPADPWVASATAPSTVGVTANAEATTGAALFAACASCHGADGMGRSDGSVPRLAGQRAAVLVDKLVKLRTGAVTLPVMAPFARGLHPREVTAVAQFIAAMPGGEGAPGARPWTPKRPDPTAADRTPPVRSDDVYAASCAACHGPHGMGNDALGAPRLCGQHAIYIARRIDEISSNARGDADPAMRAMLATVPSKERSNLVFWLASGACAP